MYRSSVQNGYRRQSFAVRPHSYGENRYYMFFSLCCQHNPDWYTALFIWYLRACSMDGTISKTSPFEQRFVFWLHLRFQSYLPEHIAYSTFTWHPKWTQNGLRFHSRIKFHFGVGVTSLSAFIWFRLEWNPLRCKFHFSQIDQSEISNRSEFSM